MVRLAAAPQRQFTRALAPEGLLARQFSVLAHLACTPGVSSGALACLVRITLRSMGTLLASLERAGWIERDPGPGLPMGVRLTRQGRGVLGRVQKRAWAANTQAMSGLSEAEVTQLNRLLHRVLEGTARRR